MRFTCGEPVVLRLSNVRATGAAAGCNGLFVDEW
jgi:hypothetical protein